MNNKAPLALMEQLVMILVFAISAAFCMQIFVASHQISSRCEAKDHAVTAVQNAAESLKLTKGDPEQLSYLIGGVGDQSSWVIGYDDSWMEVSQEQADYLVYIDRHSSDSPLMHSATVTASTSEGDNLFEVVVSWQEAEYE